MMERSYFDVVKDVTVARRNGVIFACTPKELAEDTLLVLEFYKANLEKYLKSGMTAPAKRARDASKILETLGKSFRLQSVKYSKNGEE